jgi:hypothetical protein
MHWSIYTMNGGRNGLDIVTPALYPVSSHFTATERRRENINAPIGILTCNSIVQGKSGSQLLLSQFSMAY